MLEERRDLRPARDANRVSSLAAAIAMHTDALTLVAPRHLYLWLPDLVSPPGWAHSAIENMALTRMLTRRLGASSHWDGCDVLNLYCMSGTVGDALVLENADRTLRDSGANDIHVSRVDVPRQYEVIAARATGQLDANGRTICAQYSYYAVNTAAGAALIDHSVLVGYDALATLAPEVEEMTDSVYRSLLASIEHTPNLTHPQSPSIATREHRAHPHMPTARQTSESVARESQ